MNTSRDIESSSNAKIGNTKPSMSSAPRLRQKDPRIFHVSRAFGGKDRHSKVCTIRGLRDRRVRLSVPTATQLYDLQEKLGLNQPSKVVDWLLDVAKDDIDKLPPLPFPPDSLTLNHQALMLGNTSQLNRDGVKLIHGSLNYEDTGGNFIGRHGFTEDLHNLNLLPLQSVNLTTASRQNFLFNSMASFSGFNFVNQPIIKPLHFTIAPRHFQDGEDQTNNQ